jgi:hypothetical protein
MAGYRVKAACPKAETGQNTKLNPRLSSSNVYHFVSQLCLISKAGNAGHPIAQ